ncbi:MAG: CDP-archaeol synthase [Nitrosomonas sp.]|nr:MAG: CDP-archaeol synthase [Nitrosomonas sp.]
MTIEFFQLLSLILAANGAPVLARLLLGDKFNAALDNGIVLADHQPIFGISKTWRGCGAALLATIICAQLLGYSLTVGVKIALSAIAGDLLSSFIKRRLSLPSSTRAPLLDQIPETLFPALMMMRLFELQLYTITVLVISFTVIDLVITHCLYHWRILRKSR